MNLFGTDGIRGVANKDLSWKVAFKLGRSLGVFLSQGQRIGLAKDTRLSGDMLESALIAGLTSAGRDVVRFGVVTTPGLSFLIREAGLGGGVMVSASHNPYEYNGLKVFGPDGKKIPDEMEILVSQEILKDEDEGPFPAGREIGRVYPGEALVERYLDFLAELPRRGFRGFRVVLDAANGSTSFAGPKVWERLGAHVEVLNCEPDGCNINRDCGSTHPEGLSRKVVEGGFDAGFAFDGDGDRCIAVDEKGQFLDGDHILAVMALDLARRGALAKNCVVGTVMANLGLEVFLERQGITLIRTPVGDRFVLEKMDQEGLSLGGEQSGHIIFRDILPAGDGLITSLLLADAAVSTGKRFSELRALLTKIPQVMVNVRVEDPKVVAGNHTVLQAVERVRKDLGYKGRVLVRASGTEPLVRIMVESEDDEKVTWCIKYLREVIERTSLKLYSAVREKDEQSCK